eukprot:CAMPEP_0167800980 /NCGR_PEP_ID=MMETSP0111_2-20121227/18118_1 /TAXON_ID=91324 /ORGANISM="Lotharella globosa, Strain CCCM811" /LENGTH=86 /DNA_ID=CAMNT_0007696471 /DNA_START=211 /DNA_END=468 /DNA_ORIENTATION=+
MPTIVRKCLLSSELEVGVAGVAAELAAVNSTYIYPLILDGIRWWWRRHLWGASSWQWWLLAAMVTGVDDDLSDEDGDDDDGNPLGG